MASALRPEHPAPSGDATDWLDQTWDVVVVGTGMGGSVVGHALAERGHSVLFLERGHDLMQGSRRAPGADDIGLDTLSDPAARLRVGQWPTRLLGQTNRGAIEGFPSLGCGTGGSTLIYAAQLERLFPQDFEPGTHFADVPGSTLPKAWPIAYDELLPHYREAERLFRVCGSADPIGHDTGTALRVPPPMSACDDHFLQSFRTLGLQPYQAHVACDFVAGCVGCGGQVCERGCKGDARRACLSPALQRPRARLVADCEVLRVLSEGSRVVGVSARWQGGEHEVLARVVVLAAGALFTPRILLDSRTPDWPDGLANRSGAVGRNLMFHASDFAAIQPRSRMSIVGPQKALALNDFYVGEDGKFGTFQSVGIPLTSGIVAQQLKERLPPLPRRLQRLAALGCRLVGEVAQRMLRGATLFATITEDLPYWHNRVIADPAVPGGVRFEYHYPPELQRRTRRFRQRLTQALQPHHRVLWLRFRHNLNFGHACGTCRFGDDPAASVLDRDNKAHGIDNLYVVDASFFPSSGGTNPSLTIAANALRVAPTISERLGALEPV